MGCDSNGGSHEHYFIIKTIIMTIDERNTKLQDLRKRLAWLRTEQLSVEQSIKDINREYQDSVMFNDTSVTELFEDML